MTVLTYEPLAATYTLRRALDGDDPTAVFAAAWEPFEALAEVVTPLALNVWVAGDRPLWHLAVADPPGVRPAAPAGRDFEIVPVPALTPARLRSWYADMGTPPFEALVCEDQLAVLAGGPAEVEVHLHQRIFHRPCIASAVAFPLPGANVNPPVRVSVSNEGDALVAEVWVSWAPWSEAGTPEHASVRDGLRRLPRMGWLS